MATETGYHNALASPSGHRPASERAAAIYLPRLYLEHFRTGFARTFLYELIDQRPDASRSDPEANFGLLRHDFTPKPAFAALRNLITLLRDEGGAGTGGSLRYRLEGDSTGIEQLLFSKRDGSFYLALWQSASAFDTAGVRDLYPPERQVTVTLDGPARAEIYRPGSSAAPLAAHNKVRQVRLAVPTDVVVVKLTGRPGEGPEASGSVPAAQTVGTDALATTPGRHAVQAKLSADAAAAARLLRRTGRRRLSVSGGFRPRVRPLLAGSYEVELLRARRTCASRARSCLTAQGSRLGVGRRAFGRAHAGQVSVRLTRHGTRVLSRAGKARLTLRLRFVDAGGRGTSVTRKVMLAP